MTCRSRDKFWRPLILTGLIALMTIIVTSCVGSKPKTGGRTETEVKLPPKSARIKPELHRAKSDLLDPFGAHTPNWNQLTRQLSDVRTPLGKKFIVEGFGPFIIASNLSREQLEEIKVNTIRASYNAFYKDFFTTSPQYLTTIYLFKNHDDYTHYCRKLFNEKPSTPYGFYSSQDRMMLMNISTGTGTLVHEMTHAILEADFPDIPTWFNEGFAALFEQCRIDNGSIRGLTNWRYPIFKSAIDAHTVVKLRRLMKTSNEEFYDDRDGFNYAEARYLCYYLQEKGLLRTFYLRFKENYRDDPSGIKTLEEVLKKDLDTIEKEWVEWARNLSPVVKI